MDVNSLIAQAKAETAQLEDQTDTSSGGGFEYETPPAGPAMARFVGYVEIGRRKQRPYQGKPKPDADEVFVFFELNGKKHTREVDVDGEKRTFTNIIRAKLKKKHGDKAAFTKLFKKMLYGRDGITHMAQMLGEPFLVAVIHNTVEKDGKKNVYANLSDADGNWNIGAPVSQTDPLDPSSTQPLPVPEPSVPLKLLLWNAPSKAQWDSLFIDGTRTVKDKDGEREVSKNWLQEDIVQNALNFEGSALQALMGGIGNLTLDSATETPAEAPVASGAPTPAATPAAPAPFPAAGPDYEGDVLSALGL